MEDVEVWPQQEIRWKRNAGANSWKILRSMEFGLISQAMGEPLRLYQQERVVMKTMLKGWYCNKLPLIEETDEQRLLEPSRPLYMSGEP